MGESSKNEQMKYDSIYIYILLLFMSIHTYIMSKSIYTIHFDITIHTSRTRQGGLSS